MSDEPTRWKHKPGDVYLHLVSTWFGNPTDGFDSAWGAGPERYADRAEAWRAGFRILDRSDDFNLGVIRNGRFVALLWSDEVVDDDPDVLATIASKAGLTAPRGAPAERTPR